MFYRKHSVLCSHTSITLTRHKRRVELNKSNKQSPIHEGEKQCPSRDKKDYPWWIYLTASWTNISHKTQRMLWKAKSTLFSLSATDFRLQKHRHQNFLTFGNLSGTADLYQDPISWTTDRSSWLRIYK